jgi:hypothetical protein
VWVEDADCEIRVPGGGGKRRKGLLRLFFFFMLDAFGMACYGMVLYGKGIGEGVWINDTT